MHGLLAPLLLAVDTNTGSFNVSLAGAGWLRGLPPAANWAGGAPLDGRWSPLKNDDVDNDDAAATVSTVGGINTPVPRGIRWAVNEPAAVIPWLLHGATGWANSPPRD
jgi:hypothetical protein